MIRNRLGLNREDLNRPSVDEIYPTDLEVAKDLRINLLKEADREQKMMSKTFWARFGVKYRNAKRVRRIKAALELQGIEIDLNGTLGKEEPNEWISLRLPDAVPWPDDRWFKRMREREFESEAEVEFYFSLPLLEQLGYQEEDFSLHHSLIVHQGAKATKMQADIAVFADEFRNDAILVVEVKHVNSRLMQKDIGQARSYAFELHAPLYLVTNANESRLFKLGFGAGPHQEILRFRRSQLQNQWPEIVERLSRDAVINHKQTMREMLADGN